MQSMFSALFTTFQPKPKALDTWPPQQASTRYFDLHPVGAILRSLFLSSLLWVFLAFTLYSVYTFVVAAK
ncbi:MAG: hypothetical protein ABI072_10920 [Edaphobacter sp.]